jgi:hypothetical protein
MDLKKPRDGERLVDVRMDKHGNTRVHKYTTSSSRVTIDEVRAKEPQIKRIADAAETKDPEDRS